MDLQNVSQMKSPSQIDKFPFTGKRKFKILRFTIRDGKGTSRSRDGTQNPKFKNIIIKQTTEKTTHFEIKKFWKIFLSFG